MLRYLGPANFQTVPVALFTPEANQKVRSRRRTSDWKQTPASPWTTSDWLAWGIVTVQVWCCAPGCKHHADLKLDDLPSASFHQIYPRLFCTACGELGAACIAPVWTDAKVSPAALPDQVRAYLDR